LTFSIHFIRVSPFDSHALLLASRDGVFSHIDLKAASHNHSELTLNFKPLIDLYFHPFLPSAVTLVFDYRVLLYFQESNTLIPVHPNSNPNDCLIAAYFPDPTIQQTVLLVYRSHARFMRGHAGHEAAQTIKYLAGTRESANHARCKTFSNGRLYVFGSGGSLQIFELRGPSFWGIHVLRGAPAKVADFTVSGPRTLLGCNRDLVVGDDGPERRNVWPPHAFYRFFQKAVDLVVEVSDELFVIVAAVDNRTRVFFFGIRKKTFESDVDACACRA
jgi:hypothetical protein